MLDKQKLLEGLLRNNSAGNSLGLQFGINRPITPMPTDISTLGKSGLQKYVIAVKENGTGEWPMQFFNNIQRARRLYDAGTHEMCQQKRNDGWIVLYLIPRKQATKTRTYFSRRDYF